MRTRTENRIKGDVSTKAGCLAIADALTKAGVTKVNPYPLHRNVSIKGLIESGGYPRKLRRCSEAMEKSHHGA